ncbi:hypothetical protein BU17DRAFT_75277 [Hysterangium stoloniferum]|nr:hypothetical protein BU17DRAFT_75277 [Hysterangium stoloniferum]
MSQSEQQPLLTPPNDVEGNSMSRLPRIQRWRANAAEKIETKTFHRGVMALIMLDSILVLIDLSYTFLSSKCTPEVTESPEWVEILSHISLVITCLFLAEFLVCTWAFGLSYYSPFRSILHFCDGSVIITTFVLEVALRGRQRELASLLVLFRLIRFAAEAAVGVGELEEETAKELETVKKLLEERTRALEEAQHEIRTLKPKVPQQNTGS